VRHRKAGRKFGRNKDQRKALFRGLAASLILNERISTTEAKAKNIRPQIEKLVSIAREDTEHHRRLVRARIGSEAATRKLFEVIAPRFEDQNGGYTRIYKIGQRKGDAAPMALIEFVE
jgi:large subunit ribosomal protein L17